MRTSYIRSSYIRSSYAYPLTRAQVAYTPTVGEACQKFGKHPPTSRALTLTLALILTLTLTLTLTLYPLPGKMPFYSRGCYVSIQDRGNVKAVLQVPLTLTLTLTLTHS